MSSNCTVKEIHRENLKSLSSPRIVYQVLTDAGDTLWINKCHVVRWKQLSEGDRALISYEPTDHGYAYFLR